MPTLAIVLKGYPRLSETFIAQEILNLEKAGFDLTLFSLRHPTDDRTHPVHDEIRAKVVYLPEYLHQEPLRVMRSWWASRRQPGYREALRRFLADLPRDLTRNRVRRFGQALVLAAELPSDVPALYAHFLHTPASVARYAAIMRGLPWACSAHAKDIYTTPSWDIGEKLRHCRWLTTCTARNVEFLCDRAPGTRVMLNYHGLDLDRFGDVAANRPHRDGRLRDDPVRLLSIGRAVEKKGYPGLLRALAAIDPDLHWRLDHIGGGPLLPQLKRLATDLGLESRIHWLGARNQQEVLAAYRSADCFVLNSRIDSHGDRDGLPNVIVEAQSQGLAVVSTRLSGIPELVVTGVNGLLVEPDDDAALADALTRAIGDPVLRQEMGEAGRRRVRREFSMQGAFAPLLERLIELCASDQSKVRSTSQ